MKRAIILACLVSCLFVASCYDDEIEELKGKIEALEGTQIASLQEQVAAIKNTLPELEKTDKDLNTYIKSLQNTASNLQKSLNETNDKIEEVESALKDEISAEKTAIMEHLSALKTDLDAELAKINKTIATLQAKDAELDKKIVELKAYVDTELAKNKDWVNATFATLEQYSSLATEIATIKSSITALNKSIESLEKRMAETVTTEIAKALEPIKDELVANVISDIADSYLSAIANAKDEITTAYTAAIATAVSTLETSMKSWVSDQLKGYCTIAEIEGKLATLKSTVDKNDKAIQTEIEEIGKKLSKTEEEITEAYSKAIEDAIIKYEGVINGEIATAIAEANVKIENEIKAINEKIAAIESRLDRIEGDIATIGEQIAGINATIKTLEETEAELEEYIKSLQSTAAGLQAAINETDSKIDEIESALQGEVSEAKAEVMAQLAAMRAGMEAELEQINATIAALQKKDAELDEKITDLKAYVDTELAKNTNWANATFATLEQYSVLATEVAAIKAQIVAVNTSIAELENRLNEKWENDLANATATLDATIQNKVTEITTAYSSAISDAKDEMTAAYAAAIAESISSLEASMMAWVSNKLEGYYTIAEVEGKLTALMNIVSDNDKTTKGEIEELTKSIANIKQEIANDYIDAIEKAITENNGTIDGKIAQAIEQVNSRIENEIAEINTKIAAIEDRLGKVERDIATITEQIAGINNTIEDLKDADAKLEEYIKSLQSTAAGLQAAINETDSKIDEIESALQGEVSEAKVEVMAQLAAMRAGMEAELEQINATIAALMAKDAELDRKITDLKAYVDSELANNEDWVNATFATLEQYSALATEVATIKAQIVAVNTSIAELENRLSEKWENDLANATATLGATIQEKVAEITATYTSAISDAKEEITEAYTAAIAESISSLEASMMAWVSNKLEGYYTIAEVEGKLTALMNIVSDNDKTTKAEIEELTKSIANTKKEIAEDYKNAIEEAINENNGAIDGKIAQAIAQINSNVENKIAEINAKIAAIENRLDKIERDIATIGEQITAINATIENLKETDDELEKYIKDLQSTAADLQAAINETDSKINEIERVLQGEVSQAKAELLAQLNAMRTEMVAELQQLNATVTALQAKDNELDGKIEALKSYVDTELANNKNWANATFATLEQYSALASEIATIKAQIVAVNTSIAELENRLSEKWENDLANATANLDITIQNKVAEITMAYTQAIVSAKEEIAIAYTEAIAAAVSSLESSMKLWVSEQLEGYYTIAEIEGKLAALMNIISENDKATKAEVEELTKSIANTKKEIAEDYKNAIEEAINENNGAIDGKIAQAIAQINSNVENKIAEINTKIAAIESRLDKVEGDIENIQQEIANLLKRIQSVTYIPKYSDGKATMTKNVGIDNGVAEFDFQISPKDAVADIAANWQSILSMKAVYTQTRAVSFIDLPILSFEADAANGIISITASGENLSEEFFSGNQEASVALYISDGNNSIASNFINLLIYSETGAEVIPTDEIWYTSVNGDIIDLYYPTAYDAPIISHTYQDGKGIIKFGSTLTEIQDWAFKDTQVVTLTMPNTVTKIGVKAFDNCSSLIEIGMSEAIKSIGTEAFSRSSIKSIIIPDGVTSLPSMAFSSCEYLTDVKLSKNLTSISDRVFSGCSRLKSIELPESLKSISYWAFSGTALTEITIPSNVVSISWSAFNSIKTVYCLPTTPPNASKDSGLATWSGFGNNNNLVIYVPAASLGAYKTATNWSEYASRFLGYNFEDGKPVLSNNVILYTTSNKNTVTPYTTSAFGADIISNTYENGVGQIICNADITQISSQAFKDRDNLLSMTLPESITSIGQYMFSGCSNLNAIYCKATTPPAIYYQYYMIGSFPFNAGMKIYIPRSAVDAYTQYSSSSYADMSINQINWSQYQSYIEPYDFE